MATLIGAGSRQCRLEPCSDKLLTWELWLQAPTTGSMRSFLGLLGPGPLLVDDPDLAIGRCFCEPDRHDRTLSPHQSRFNRPMVALRQVDGDEGRPASRALPCRMQYRRPRAVPRLVVGSDAPGPISRRRIQPLDRRFPDLPADLACTRREVVDVPRLQSSSCGRGERQSSFFWGY